MASMITTVRLDTGQYQAVKEMAAFSGVSVSTMMRQIIAERIADEADYRDAVKLMKQGGLEPVNPAKLRAELGLPEPARV